MRVIVPLKGKAKCKDCQDKIGIEMNPSFVLTSSRCFKRLMSVLASAMNPVTPITADSVNWWHL
jgi:hypothetical protein